MTRPPVPRDREYWIVSSALTAAAIAVAVAAAWPLYESATALAALVGAVVLAAGCALVAELRGWSAGRRLAIAVGGFAGFAVIATVPRALLGGTDLGSALVGLATSIVAGWKNLLTIQLPVGDYQMLVVPGLVVFWFGSFLALSLAWRPERGVVAAAAPVVAMGAAALLLGPSTASAPTSVLGVVAPAPREAVLGLAGLLALGALSVWRSGWARRRSLSLAADPTVAVSVSRRAALARRLGGGAAMLLVAVVIAGLVFPAALTPRQVLRSSVTPLLALRSEVSPLSSYRSAFESDRLGEVLFRVSAEGELPARLRLAVLPEFDGSVFRVRPADAAPVGEGDFRRVPGLVAPATGPTATVELRVDGLDGIWVPLPAGVSRVEFPEPRAGRSPELDGFYFSSALDAGIQLADGGLAPGDVLRITAATQPLATDVAALGAGSITESDLLPAALMAWVDDQELGADGAALASLAERLRARGYLSHSWLKPAADAEASWLELSGTTSFVPSRAGHNLDRLGVLFDSLRAKAESVGPVDDAQSRLLVAAVGDDEQFAAALALIARYLGFESRVVVGFRLATDGSDLPACADDGCRWSDLAAWVEVRRPGDAGWVTLDATPQAAEPPLVDAVTRRDPEIATVVPSREVDVVAPTEVLRADDEPADDEAGSDLDLRWLGVALGILGTVVGIGLALTSPLWVILGAKALRRALRRRASDPEQRVTRGWDEWLDLARDRGARIPARSTRPRIAAALAARADDAGMSLFLADRADRAVFAADPPSDAEAAHFWALVDAERRRWRAEEPRAVRWRAALSLASLLSLHRAGSIARRLLRAIPRPSTDRDAGPASTTTIRGRTGTRRRARLTP